MKAPAATGRVLRWVDGDTVWIATRLRITRSAPELSTAAGRAAKEAAQRSWPKAKPITFTVRWVDAHGRIVADLHG